MASTTNHSRFVENAFTGGKRGKRLCRNQNQNGCVKGVRTALHIAKL